jgi:hypothetical protein
MSAFEPEWLQVNGNIFNLDHISHIHLGGSKIDIVYTNGNCELVFTDAKAAKEAFDEIHDYLKNR